jgi:hypothetical protein
MNRPHNAFCTNSGQYVDFLRYTSTSAVMMATSSAVPGTDGSDLHAETVDVPTIVEERDVQQGRDHDPLAGQVG